MTEEQLNAIVAYMTAVNKLMAWCECRPMPDEPGYTKWGSYQDSMLRDVADTRATLTDLCKEDDAGCHRPIWLRLSEGDFEDDKEHPELSSNANETGTDNAP